MKDSESIVPSDHVPPPSKPGAAGSAPSLGVRAKVTLGLAAAGAVAGGVAGFLFAAVVTATATAGLPSLGVAVTVLAFGGIAGAALGTVLGPVAAWLLMRHVPLGLAIGGTTLGALAGGLAGWFLVPGLDNMPLPFSALAPLAGFGAAALWMRRRVPGARPISLPGHDDRGG